MNTDVDDYGFGRS